MKSYCLFDCLQVNDTEKLEAYKKEVIPLVEKFGGKYIINRGKIKVIEGEWKPTFLVMIEFPNQEDAWTWYNSTEYQLLKDLRLSISISNGIIIEQA